MPDHTSEHVERLLEDRKAKYATVAFVDHHGQLRGKTISTEKLVSALAGGISFSPFTYLLDLGDRPLHPGDYLTRDIAIEDNVCRVVGDSPRTLPFEDNDANLFFFIEFEPGSRGHGWDPRAIYHRIEDRLGALALRPRQALEYEFRIFRETPESARQKGYRNLALMSDTSSYGGIMRQGVYAEFFRELREMCAVLEIPIESLHWEVAPSLAEAALRYRDGIAAADDAALFKTHAKVLAHRHDLLLSFMARPLDGSDGQSGHVHLSLLGKDDAYAFHDPKADHGISTTMRHFIGGVTTLMPELLLLLAPNVNAFKRLLPGHFAPVAANWGVDNRTTAVRAIPGSPASQRLECRVGGSDANPYLVLAAINGAGAWGIERKIEPEEPTRGNTYLGDKKLTPAQRFPVTFMDAVRRFGDSKTARELLGDDFVSMFAGTREAQAKEFAAAVSDLELARFLELA